MYQIYPRSFCDSNGDGIGDLPGIISRLDYLNGAPESLGIDVIWLSPFYPSPMADFGYDVSDYRDVDPRFGTLKDFKKLLQEAHARDIKVAIDFIPNHTSEEHAWFQQSRASRANAKRDWYVWADPKPDGSPPNNWVSVFGGPAWQFDETTGQYYLHSFLKQQPDLNWRNPEVREAMLDNMKFWLDMGVDGFRVDAVAGLSKDRMLRDDPINPNYRPHSGQDPYEQLIHEYSAEGPHLFEYLRDMAEMVKSYPRRFMVTEYYPDEDGNVPAETREYLKFYTNVDPSVSAPLNFEGITTDWDMQAFRQHIDTFQRAMGDDYAPVYCMGNHDKSRLASRFGRPAARVAATLQLTTPGMPVIYYGDELGMIDGVIPAGKHQDPFAAHHDELISLNRDPERTPMPWNNEPGAGFTTGKPWLPINHDHVVYNVESERYDEVSFWTMYRRLLRLRKQSVSLRHGNFTMLPAQGEVMLYRRESSRERYIVMLNFSASWADVALNVADAGETVFSTHPYDAHEPKVAFRLRPYEAIVVEATQR